MTRFVVLAAPRCGSNLLCTLLNSHPQVLCHHEIFNPQGVITARDYTGDEFTVESLQQRDDDPLSFLHRVWRSGSQVASVGFKWTRGQNELVLQHVLEDAGIKKIVLRRNNRIKTFVSEKIAQQTGQWEVYRGDRLKTPRPQIRIDTPDLLRHITLNEDFYEELDTTLSRSGQPQLQLQYERLFDRDVQVRMFEFLAVPDPEFPPTATSIKQNPRDLRKTIANFDELSASLPDDALKQEILDVGI